jgi:CRP/FNR family transcriptional regulator
MPAKLNEIVTKCHLFSGLTAADIELLATVVRWKTVSKSEVLFEEGQAADGFYLVESGKVKVYKLSADGKEHILHIVQPGNSFADAAIFGNGLFPAFAEALSDANLLFFPKTPFLNLLHQHSQLSINMIAGLSRHLRQFAMQIEDLTLRDVPARLSRYLLQLSRSIDGHIELPLSKNQLASNLGTTSESLSRTLRKLIDEEVLQVKGRSIKILDSDRLSDLARIDSGA